MRETNGSFDSCKSLDYNRLKRVTAKLKKSFCVFNISSIYLQHICFPTHPSAPPPAAGELVVPDADSESKPTRTRVDEDRELQEAMMRPPEEGELAESAAKQLRLSKFFMSNDQSPWSVEMAGGNTFCLVGMISHYAVATHSVHYSPPCTASTRTAGSTTTTAGSAAWTCQTSWGIATRKTAMSSFTCIRINARRATAEMCRGTAQFWRRVTQCGCRTVWRWPCARLWQRTLTYQCIHNLCVINFLCVYPFLTFLVVFSCT